MPAVAVYLVFAMLATLWFDLRHYIIPNWLAGSLLALYPLAVWLSPSEVDWPMAILGMIIMFAVGYGIFVMKWMGAGDIKLLTVCSLWVGWEHLLDYVFTVALLGGAFVILLYVGRKLLPRYTSRPMPRVLRDGEPAPYGVAIAIGLLLMLWQEQVPVLAV